MSIDPEPPDDGNEPVPEEPRTDLPPWAWTSRGWGWGSIGAGAG